MNKLKAKSKLCSMILGGCITLCVIPTVFVEARNAFVISDISDQEIINYCEEIGQIYNICPELLEAIIEIESSNNPNAIGDCGEIGLMQIYPKYHQDRMIRLGVDSLQDPYSNILVGADYLLELFNEYQDLPIVLMVYNGSSDAIERGKTYNLTEYAKRVIARSHELERLHNK